MPTSLGELLIRRGLYPLSARVLYPLATRRRVNDDMVFLNWGYEDDPPMALPLDEADEPNRYSIQLYYRVATQAELTGKQVLEVSCGHGGGASYLMRTLRPASYTGLDLNRDGVEFCQQKHQLPSLDFVQGNAQDLPFADGSFDAVINIEASHCYPRVPRFFAEVARVLRPGGDFLYADVRAGQFIPAWERALAAAPLQLVSQADISAQVARGLKKNLENMPAFMSRRMRESAPRGLQRGRNSYRMYHFTTTA